MKNARRVLSLLAVSALLMPGVSAFASLPASQPARPTQSDMHWQRMQKDFQIEGMNRGGMELSQEVFAERQIAALAPVKFDRDGNGRFDETEFNTWLRAVRSAVVESPGAMKRFDANQDGKLDANEWSAVVGQLTGKA